MPTPTRFSYGELRSRETAVVRVNGKDFYNWESVYVSTAWGAPYPDFRFTSTEDTPAPGVWLNLQFKPGDVCTIFLGGVQAIDGIIISRQTSYNAASHGVMLQGVGIQYKAARASHVDSDGNFDGLNFEGIVDRILKPHEAKPSYMGTIDKTPLTAQIQPGESNWQFLERIGRIVGVIIGHDKEGHILFIGSHQGDSKATLTEGENILSCQATISIDGLFSRYIFRGQFPATDSFYGPDAAEQEASAPGTMSGYCPLVTPLEQPCSTAQMANRATNESKWREGSSIQAVIVVQGWFKPDGGLWTPGEAIFVKSPSAMLDQVLKVQQVTYLQDRNQGTLTQLHLVPPWKLNDQSRANFNNPNAPQQPPAGTVSTQPSVPAPEAPPPPH
jgi:prophage tail gpP-like protein